MRRFRCYAVGRSGNWEAVCIDLSLAAQGRSLDEVRQTLSESIIQYLDYVEGLPVDEQEAFLNRKAPLGQRMEFYRALLSWLLRRGGDSRDDKPLSVPVFCDA